MKTSWLPVLALMFCLQAGAQDTLPADVRHFIERRDLCDHFRSEEAYDAERGQFLAARSHEFCTGTDRQLAALKKKYKTTPEVLSRLAMYTPRIEDTGK